MSVCKDDILVGHIQNTPKRLIMALYSFKLNFRFAVEYSIEHYSLDQERE